MDDHGVGWRDIGGPGHSANCPGLGRHLDGGNDVNDSTPTEDYRLRKPCIVERNGQQCVYCGGCGSYRYCAPKTETGLPQRSVSTRPNLKPSQRARILERDHCTCVFCNQSTGVLHIGHLLSVDDGRKLGATDAELWSDQNLATLCELCNLGFGRSTPSLVLVYRVLKARLARSE